LLFLARVVYDAVFASMPGFVAIDHSLVKTPLAGRLVHSVAQGDAVRAGDTVAQLRNELLESQRDALRASLAAARRRMQAQTAAGAPPAAPPNPAAQPMLALRQSQYRSMRDLVDEQAATQSELDEAYVALLQARGHTAAVASRIAASPAPDDTQFAALAERLADVEARIAALRLVAPRDGMVSQVFPKTGEWLAENTEVADVRARRAPKVEVYVDPASASEASVGKWATIRFLDGYTHRAMVAEVKTTAQRLPADRANPLVVRHHSVIAMLDPVPALPDRYRINILPVDVTFDIFPSDQKGNSVWLSKLYVSR
ncbi:HlyD family efflux transporter periplasmic adaptor subunit, partial [Massilia sp. BSC265]|uniref:HlyD family efflux transporter periplasmic adaptor subunit n=1 Tax=Massilia sp. BSC265 TaxID=1549812 RepID=UPI0004E8E8AF